MKTKRMIAALLVLAMLLPLCACGKTAAPEMLPEELSGRKLSDEELLALKPDDPQALRAAISTVEDAAAWFTVHGYRAVGMGGIGLDEYPGLTYLPSAAELFGLTLTNNSGSLGGDEVNRIAAWLLQDDIPGTGALASVSPREELLCLPGEGGWHLINAARLVTPSSEGGALYQFCEKPDGRIAGWGDGRDGERALVTELEQGVAYYEYFEGETFVWACFLGRDDLTLLRVQSDERLAQMPDEETSSAFLRELSRGFGLKVEDSAVPASVLAQYGMRRLDETERGALLGGRKRSDEELAALDRGDPDALRAALSTPEDVAAWFRMQDFGYWDGAMVSDTPMSYRFRYPDAVFMLQPEGLGEVEAGSTYIGRDSINLLAAWLLQDDYDDCGALLVLVPDNMLGCMNRSALCIGLGEEHVLLNMASMIDMVTLSGSRENLELLDGLAIRDLKDFTAYIDCIDGDKPVQHGEIALLRDFTRPTPYVDYGPWACFEDRSVVLWAEQPDETVDEYTLRHGANEQDWAFLDFDIDAFPIPEGLGKSRLSEAEIAALVGQDVDLVADRVDTVADLIAYLHAGGFSFGNSDIWQDDFEDDTITWHFNKTARAANLTRCIDCGATANLVRYVLDGDYEVVGIVCNTYYNGDGGGHVYNYICDGGKYYVLDLTQMTGGRYRPDALRILEMDELSEFVRKYRDEFSSPYGGYGKMAVIYAYDAAEDIPIAWKKEGEDACSVTWYPSGAELQILFEDRENGYSAEKRDMSAQTAAAIARSRSDNTNTWGYYRPEDFPGVEAYGFPEAFGQATMSYEEMLRLVWTADMETLAEKIKTVPDLMMYFCAAGYSGESTDIGGGGSDIHVDAEGGAFIWHYNEYAERTRFQSSHGCGQCAATVRYLLDGDYEELGYLSCTWAEGMGGGHNFNYIKAGGVYYALDMNGYDMRQYDPRYPQFLEIGKNLSAFRNNRGQLFGDGMMCCYASPLMREIPVGWEGERVKTSYLPEQYENEIRILWTTEDEGYAYRFVPLKAEWEAYMDLFRAAS